MENMYEGYSKRELEIVEEILANFYYGKDLKRKSIRKFYKSLLKDMRNELEDAKKHLK